MVIPTAVRDEMLDAGAPAAVRQWIGTVPTWLAVEPAPSGDEDPALQTLDKGERAAIGLAAVLRADLVHMDDRAGVAAARARGLTVTGTPGVLDIAAARGLIDVAVAVEALQATNFHVRQPLVDALLSRHSPEEGSR